MTVTGCIPSVQLSMLAVLAVLCVVLLARHVQPVYTQESMSVCMVK
jgi:hypothetical protein